MPKPSELALGVAVCEHFGRELEFLAREANFGQVRTGTFACRCGHPRGGAHPAPQREQPEQAYWPQKPCAGLVVIGCCISPTFMSEAEYGVIHRERLPQCFSIFAGRAMTDALLQGGAYITLPSWLVSWKATLEIWGFDQQTARAFFNESCTRIVLLDTGINPDSGTQLIEFARYVDRPCSIEPVGLDYFRLYLHRRLSLLQQDLNKAQVSSASNKKEADEMMLLDLLENLSYSADEQDVVKIIMEMHIMLFAPGAILFLPILDGSLGQPYSPEAPVDISEVKGFDSWLLSSSQRTADDGEGGFMVRIQHKGSLFGGLWLRHIAFGQYLERYKVKAASISRLCGLILQNARLYKTLESQARIDDLTGLMNRRFFFEQADREFMLSKRHSKPLSAIMLDLDYFKIINDTHGHRIGDRVLKSVASVLRTMGRRSDLCGRYGGEEFVVLLPETGSESALLFAERFRAETEALKPIPERPDIGITVSLGIAELTAEDGLADLLKLCDEALYKAKHRGRNRVVVWESG